MSKTYYSKPDEAPNKPMNPADKRRKKRQFRWAICIAALLMVTVYIGTQLFFIWAPRMQVELAIRASMDDVILAEGFVAMRSEQIEDERAQSHLHYTVDAGERVAQGSPVAKIFASQEALEAYIALESTEREIDQLEAAQRIAVEGGSIDTFYNQRQQSMYEWLRAVETGDFGSLQNAKDDVAMAAHKIQIITGDETDFAQRLAQLYEQKANYETIAVPTGEILAPKAGYFVPSQSFDRPMVHPDDLDALSAAQLKEKLGQATEYYSSNVVGHIVTSYKWSFVAVIPVQAALRLSPGLSVGLSFSEYSSDTVPVQVSAVTPDADGILARVELSCENINKQIVGMRSEQAQIILRSFTGIRVDKRALRIVDGNNGVYVRFGNMAFFKRIDVLLDDGSYYLVQDHAANKVGWIELYDEVIVDAGGMELHDKKIL